MAFVYRATDERLDRTVALKVLAPEHASENDFRERFLRESRFAASLDHPNIVPIYEADEANGLLYIAMRYVSGDNLDSLLWQLGPLPPDRLIVILSAVARALDAAHDAGLVHRDVKPANILLSTSGGRDGHEHVYLSDFGVTKRTSGLTKLTATGHLVGTMAYSAPEQIRGQPVDARTDLYALGCVAYECLTGVPPFVRDDQAALLWAHLSEQATAVSVFRPELRATDAVLARALAKDPADRYQTCEQFTVELAEALTPHGSHAFEARASASPPTAETLQVTTGELLKDSGESQVPTQPRLSPEPHRPPGTASTVRREPPLSVAVTGVPTRRRANPVTVQIALAAVVVAVLVGTALILFTGHDSARTGSATIAPISAVSGPSPSVTKPAGVGGPAPTTGPTAAQSSIDVLPTSSAIPSTAPIPPVRPTPATPKSGKPLAALALPRIRATITLGGHPGPLAVTPDGKYVYVVDTDAKIVRIIDTATDRSTSFITIAQGPPRFITFAPDGRHAYVSIYNDSGTVNAVAVLDTSTDQETGFIAVDKIPYSPAVTPDGKYLYVPSHFTAQVDVVKISGPTSPTIVARIKVPPNPHWVDFTPDGKRAFVADHESNVLTVIDVASGTMVKTISVGDSPHSVAVSPDGSQVAVVCYMSNDVFFVNTRNLTVANHLAVGNNPRDVVYSPDGRYVYIANESSNSVSVVPAGGSLTYPNISTTSPQSIAVLPNGAKAYVANLDAGNVTVLLTA